MTAADTNIVVRLLTGDGPKQSAAARSLFEAGPIWIAKTVLLETCWVLGSIYGFEQDEIQDAYNKLLDLDNVNVEDASAVASALALTAQGIEFADAIHFFSRPPGAGLVSFDKSFVRDARRAGAMESRASEAAPSLELRRDPTSAPPP